MKGSPVQDRGAAESILILQGLKPAFPAHEIALGHGLSVVVADRTFVDRLESIGVPAGTVGESTVCIKGSGTSSTEDLLRPYAVAKALTLASNCRVATRQIIFEAHGPSERSVTVGPPSEKGVWWGHSQDVITAEDLNCAAKLWPRIGPHILPDTFTRVSNALRFYNNGYTTQNPDLALVAFTTCLESLFSTVEQEISFRLSLRLATFLGDDNATRERLFGECKGVYRVRSKVVHGAAIARSSERAAIYLVEGVMPNAEGLARKSLAKIFDMRLESVFNDPAKVNTLFDKLLFSTSLEQAISTLGTSG